MRSTEKMLNLIYRCCLKITYVRPILLGIREIYVCGKCNVLLNQEETDVNEEEQHNSVHRNRCWL